MIKFKSILNHQDWLMASIVLIGAAIIGMRVTHYWTWSSIDILPIIARFRDPNFLVNDLYTNINGGFSARTYFAHTIDWLSQLVQTEPALLLSYLNPVIFGLAGLGLYLLALGFQLPAWLAAITTVIILTNVIPQPTLGAWRFVVNQTVPAWVATSLIVVAAAGAQRKRLLATTLALLLATLAHPTTTLLATPLLGAFYVLDQKTGWSPARLKHFLVSFGVISLVIIIFFLIPGRQSFVGQTISALSTQLFYDMFVVIRHPHHYDALAWPTQAWLNMAYYGLAWLIVLIALYRHKADWSIRMSALITVLFGAIMLVSHILLVNLIHSRPIMILSPIRLVGLIWPFFMIYTVVALYLILKNSSPPIQVKFPTDSHRFTLMLVAVALVGLIIQGRQFSQKILAEKTRFEDQHRAFFNCVDQTVPKDQAVILHPRFDSVLFRMIGKRTVYGDDVFPFNEQMAGLWWQQYTAVHGKTKIFDLANRYDRLTTQDFRRIFKESGGSYFLILRANDLGETVCQTPNFRLVHRPFE